MGLRFEKPLNYSTAAALVLCLAVTLLAAPQTAQAERRVNPMHFTTLHGRSAQADSGNRVMKFTASPAEEAKPATDDDAATETQEESPAAQVWRRYKALAAGTPEPEESEKDSKIEEKTSAIKKPEEVKAVAVKEEEKQPVGFEAVIQEYRRAKEQRKTLHSLSVSRPEPPAAPKSPDSSKTP